MQRRVAVLARIGSWIGKPRGWERVVRWFAPPEKCESLGEIRVVREGAEFGAFAATAVGWNVLLFGTYEPELREIFREVLRPGGVAVDVGANVGWHTLLLASLAGPAGRVLAAEPNPSVRERLLANLAANSVTNVTVLPFAFAESDRTERFLGPAAEDAESGSGHLAGEADRAESPSFEVPVRRADPILAAAELQRLDLIKIDVEGFELPVLLGATDAIARFRPTIVFEFNSDYVGRSGADSSRFEEFFSRHGYRLFELTRQGARPLCPGSWPANADILARPEA